MRALIGLVAAIGLLSAIAPATVSAAKPTQYSVVQSTFGCDVSSTAGEVSLYVQIDDEGVFASLFIWAPGTDPEFDPPTMISDAHSVSLDGSLLAGGFELFRLEFSENPEEPPILTPVGFARMSAELIENGAPFDFGSDSERAGNVLMKATRTVQLYDLDGGITVDFLDGTVTEIGLNADACDGSVYTTEWFGTNPNGWVTSEDQVLLSCEWDTETGTVTMSAYTDEQRSQGELFIVSPDGALAGFIGPVLSATTYEAYTDLFDAVTRETVGSATAQATLSPSGERITEHERIDPVRYSVIGESLHVDGTLTMDIRGNVTTLVMDDSSCDAAEVRVQLQQKMGRS